MNIYVDQLPTDCGACCFVSLTRDNLFLCRVMNATSKPSIESRNFYCPLAVLPAVAQTAVTKPPKTDRRKAFKWHDMPLFHTCGCEQYRFEPCVGYTPRSDAGDLCAYYSPQKTEDSQTICAWDGVSNDKV